MKSADFGVVQSLVCDGEIFDRAGGNFLLDSHDTDSLCSDYVAELLYTQAFK